MRKKDWLVASALALCVVGLVACGGGGSGSGGGGSASAKKKRRSNSPNACAPTGSKWKTRSRGRRTSKSAASGDPATKKALAACNGKLGNAGQELSSEEGEEFREGALALAQCMREEGIEMGDPKILGPGKFLLDIEGVDTESPAFEAAQEACGEKLPELSGVTVGG